MGTNRLEAFSDGVIAVAVTLLVLDIRVPELGPHETLLHALLNDTHGVLSPAERQLLSDWLDRLAASTAVSAPSSTAHSTPASR